MGEGGYGCEGLAVVAAGDEVVDVGFVEEEGHFWVEGCGGRVVGSLGFEGCEEVGAC